MFLRILGIITAAVFGSYAFVAWPRSSDAFHTPALAYSITAALVAASGLALALARLSSKPLGTLAGAVLGGLTLGLVGLVAGVVFGVTLRPQSNLAGLDAFIVTGPAGVLIGGIVGGVLGSRAGKGARR
jgi:hypothetical protein